MSSALSLFLVGSLFSALWASAFIAGKVALATMDPLSLLVARFAVAGVLMVGWRALRSGGGQIVRRDLVIDGILLGILNNALYLGLSFVGLQTVSPATTVLIVSTAPFMTTALAAATGGPRSMAQLLGAVVGFAGVYVVLSGRMGNGGDDPIGLLLILAGTLAFAIGTVAYRVRATHHDPVALNGLQNLIGALILLPFAAHPAAPFAQLANLEFLMAFVHLVAAVSIVDFLIWLGLVRKIGAAHASSFHLLNPVFGVLQSAALFGTAIAVRDIAGTAIVVVGLMIVTRDTIAHNRTAARPAPADIEPMEVEPFS